MQLDFQLANQRLAALDFFRGHLAQIGVAVFAQHVRLGQIGLRGAEGLISFDHRLKLGVLLGVSAKARLIHDDFGIGQQRGELFKALSQRI